MYLEKTKKVLMLVENAVVPMDRRVWAEATTLRNHGYQVSIISPKGETKHREAYICIEDIHIYRYSMLVLEYKYISYIVEYLFAMIVTFFLSIKVLFRHGFDIVHTANPPDTFFLIGLFYRLLGKKFVFDQHDLSPELFQVQFKNKMKVIHKLLLFLEWCSYQTANLVIVVNGSLKSKALQRGHCDAQKVYVVRNGPDLQKMHLVEQEPELKRGWRYLIAYAGVMAVQDGVEYALYALHHLVNHRNRQDIGLVLLGDGSYIATLRTLAHDLGLDAYVYFTGWLEMSDVLRYLSVADITIAPDPKNGLNENVSMIKVMEYMALGKPVVAFDLTEIRYMAQGAALYATPNQAEDLANKIEIVLADEALQHSMMMIGRKRIEEELNWEQNKKNLLLAYDGLFAMHSKELELGPEAERTCGES